MNVIAELKRAAREAGRVVEVIERPHGHIQVRGELLVNYYPASKRQSAYVAGTTRARTRCTPHQVVAMAFTAPPVAPLQSRAKRRRKGYRTIKLRMWAVAGGLHSPVLCFRCNQPMTEDDASVDHVIPLARGGLDNANNRRLSHEKCNNDAGHAMPELKK